MVQIPDTWNESSSALDVRHRWLRNFPHINRLLVYFPSGATLLDVKPTKTNYFEGLVLRMSHLPLSCFISVNCPLHSKVIKKLQQYKIHTGQFYNCYCSEIRHPLWRTNVTWRTRHSKRDVIRMNRINQWENEWMDCLCRRVLRSFIRKPVLEHVNMETRSDFLCRMNVYRFSSVVLCSWNEFPRNLIQSPLCRWQVRLSQSQMTEAVTGYFVSRSISHQFSLPSGSDTFLTAGLYTIVNEKKKKNILTQNIHS